MRKRINQVFEGSFIRVALQRDMFGQNLHAIQMHNRTTWNCVNSFMGLSLLHWNLDIRFQASIECLDQQMTLVAFHSSRNLSGSQALAPPPCPGSPSSLAVSASLAHSPRPPPPTHAFSPPPLPPPVAPDGPATTCSPAVVVHPRLRPRTSESPVVFSTEGGQEEEDERDGVLERLGRGAEIYRGPGCASFSGYFSLPGGGPGVSWGSSLFPVLPEEQANQGESCECVDWEVLFGKIEDSVSEMKRKLNQNLLKEKFKKEVRPYLVVWCLLLPEGLNSESTECLHHQYQKSFKKKAQYLSAYEFMLQKERSVDCAEWDHFLKHLQVNRVYIPLDWDNNIGNCETLRFDHGIKGFHKLEVDASFCEGEKGMLGKATVSIVIWFEEDFKLAKVCRDIPCENIHAAEAYGAEFGFITCEEMGIKNLVVWTDNADVHGSITGSYTIGHNKGDVGDLLLLLGFTGKRFRRLIALCKPREQLFLADHLSTNPRSSVKATLKKFQYELSGQPMYRLSLAGPATQVIKKFKWKRYLRKPQTKAYMEVDYISKFVAVAEIIATLRPSVLYLAVYNINAKPDFRSMIVESIVTKIDDEIVRGNCTILRFTVDDASYPLLIVFDATLPKETYNFVGCFTIFLPYSSERELLPAGTEELSALSYVYFNGAMKIREDEPRK